MKIRLMLELYAIWACALVALKDILSHRFGVNLTKLQYHFGILRAVLHSSIDRNRGKLNILLSALPWQRYVDVSVATQNGE